MPGTSHLEMILHALPPELVAACLPPGHRLDLARACKALYALDAKLGLSLRVLHLPPNFATRLAELSHRFRVESLNFEATGLDPRIVQDLAATNAIDWQRLHTVTLGTKQKLGHAGGDVAAWFRCCPSLAKTDALFATDLNPDVCDAVQHCSDLSLCGMPHELRIAQHLGTFLASCGNLTALDLSDNLMTTNACTKCMTGLSTLSNLTSINLSNNFFRPILLSMTMTALQTSHATLQRLDVGFMRLNRSMFAELGRGLCACTNLQELCVEFTGMKPSKIFAFTEGLDVVLTSLTRLEMGGNRMQMPEQTVASMRALMAKLPNVVHLCANQCNLTSPFLFAMHDAGWLPQMQYLNLCDQGFGMSGGDALASLTPSFAGLKHLSLSIHHRDNMGLHGLARALTACNRLEHFNLRSCVRLEAGFVGGQSGGLSAMFRALQNCPRLRHLDVHGHPLSVLPAAALAEGLSGATALRELNLSMTRLDNAGAEHVVQVMQQCWSLDVVRLAYNFLDGVALVRALRQLSRPLRITEMDVTGCRDMAALAQVAGALPLLRRLDLQDCDVEGAAVDALARAVAQWGELRMLNVASNPMQDGEREVLREACARTRCVLVV